MTASGSRATQARSLLATARAGQLRARLLAVADSRALVRSLFLASLADLGIAPALATPMTLEQLATALHCTRDDRLRAWLDVGATVRELRFGGGRWSVRGARSRSIAAGDPLLVAHYRSMLEYQTGPYAQIASLLSDDTGRTDLADYAPTIAAVSLAAAPFVRSYLTGIVAERRPRRALDIGCGTGVYTRMLLDADPRVFVWGVDLAASVASRTAAELAAEGYGARASIATADIRAWSPPADDRFDLALLCNNLYYFAPPSRAALFRRIRDLLAPDGELIVVSMTRPGSIASAHLHLMLRCQDVDAALPERAEIEHDLRAAGYEIVAVNDLVPTEPFVGVTARPYATSQAGV